MDDIIYNILCLKTGLIVFFLVFQELHLVILLILLGLSLGGLGGLADHAALLLFRSGRLACPGSDDDFVVPGGVHEILEPVCHLLGLAFLISCLKTYLLQQHGGCDGDEAASPHIQVQCSLLLSSSGKVSAHCSVPIC